MILKGIIDHVTQPQNHFWPIPVVLYLEANAELGLINKMIKHGRSVTSEVKFDLKNQLRDLDYMCSHVCPNFISHHELDDKVFDISLGIPTSPSTSD